MLYCFLLLENRRKLASFFPHTLWIVHEELLDELLYDYHHDRSNVIHFYGFHVVVVVHGSTGKRCAGSQTFFFCNDETRKKMTKNVALSNYDDCYLIDVKLSLLAILSSGASVLTRRARSGEEPKNEHELGLSPHPEIKLTTAHSPFEHVRKRQNVLANLRHFY